MCHSRAWKVTPANELPGAMAAAGLDLDEVSEVVLTHAHGDHIDRKSYATSDCGRRLRAGASRLGIRSGSTTRWKPPAAPGVMSMRSDGCRSQRITPAIAAASSAPSTFPGRDSV